MFKYNRQLCLPKFILFISLAALAFAYIAQHTFNIQPCALCFYQRYIFMAIIALSAIVIMSHCKYTHIVLALMITSGLVFSGYQVGVEKKWFPIPAHCNTQSINVNDLKKLSSEEQIAHLRAQVNNQPIVRCDEVNWRIFGISATIWSYLLFAFLTILGWRAVWINQNKR